MRHALLAACLCAATFCLPHARAADIQHGLSLFAGWDPPPEERQKVEALVKAYFQALKAGRDEDAFALRAVGQTTTGSREVYLARRAEQRTVAGGLVSWQFGTAAWSKTKSDEVVVTLDYLGRLERAQRYCGLLVVERRPGPGYVVAHHFDIVMTDAEAAELASRRSQAEVEDAWVRRAATTCPRY